MYDGKTCKFLPRFKFRKSFSLSYNENHYSNEDELIKLIEEILVVYINKVQREEDLPLNQRVFINLNVLSGQIITTVLHCFKDNNIVVVYVPANMTCLVNSCAKKFTSRKFSEWYSSQIMKQLDNGKDLNEIDVLLQVSLLKSFHAQWLV